MIDKAAEFWRAFENETGKTVETRGDPASGLIDGLEKTWPALRAPSFTEAEQMAVLGHAPKQEIS